MSEAKRRRSWRRGVRFILDRYFPERQIHLRTNGRIAFFRISQFGQLMVAAFVAGATGWAAYATMSYVRHDEVVSAKENQIATAKFAYRNLLDEVATYQRKFTDITGELEENHNLMLELVEKNAMLRRSLNDTEQRLQEAEDNRRDVVRARETLKSRLGQIESEMSDLSTRNYSLKGNLDSVETNLRHVVMQRDRALAQLEEERQRHDAERQKMAQQIAGLEDRLQTMQVAQASAVERLTERAVAHIESVERVVEMTGLEVMQILEADDTVNVAQGGPFIPVKPDGVAGGELKASLNNLDSQLGHWEALQGVMRKLPLSAPLNSYYVTSSFGKRKDPVNKRWAAHYGLDLGAPLRSPVHATAPGVVTYAGWNGRYGRYVEIDHGAGLKTRFAHMAKVLVKKGQKIDYRQKIGLLGNSGRSTGAHLHYEVVFQGTPRDPMNFINAGRHVLEK